MCRERKERNIKKERERKKKKDRGEINTYSLLYKPYSNSSSSNNYSQHYTREEEWSVNLL